MGLLSWIFGCSDHDKASPPAAQRTQAEAGNVESAEDDCVPEDVYRGLRQQVLDLKAKDLGLPASKPLAVLMETGHPRAVVTLAVIADGTTSLYFSNGGGVLGAGEHEPVRRVASAFLSDAAANADRLQPAKDQPLPKRGRVRFYLVSEESIRTAEAGMEDLGHKRHELSHLFYSAHAVITAIRENTPGGR